MLCAASCTGAELPTRVWRARRQVGQVNAYSLTGLYNTAIAKARLGTLLALPRLSSTNWHHPYQFGDSDWSRARLCR
jgi:hypothetical protein